MTERTCDERCNLSSFRRRVHLPLSILIGFFIIGILAAVSGGEVSDQDEVDSVERSIVVLVEPRRASCVGNGSVKVRS
jgi:hypothetical protein